MQTPASSSQAAYVPIATRIAAVTVYPHQARITRRGQIEVLEQRLTLEIKDLPTALQPDSVQAYPRGSAKVILQEPWIETVMELPNRHEEVGHLTRQLHQLEDTFRGCKDRLVALNLQRTFLESLVEQAASSLAQGLSQQSTSLTDISDILQFFEQSYQQVTDAIAKHERLKQDLDHQLQDTRQQLKQLHAQTTPQYRLLLPLIVEQPGLFELDIVYDVDHAQWSPLYHVRLEDNPHTLQIDCIAQVRQNTGEPWEHVDIKVSTALSGKSPALPKTGCWYINLSRKNSNPERQDAIPSRVKTRSSILDETYRMLGAVPGSEIPTAKADEEDIGLPMMKSTNAIIGFSAPEPAVVLSDDRPHQVPIGQLHLDSQFTYVALPQRYSAPYLQAHLVNSSERRPLLPGTVHLFRNGGYVGQEHLEYVAPGEPFQLSLGLDERVLTQRELVARETQAGNQCRDIRAYRLTLHNPCTHPIDITVFEQIPVSQTDRIHVSLVKAEPQTFALESGLCQWSIRLEAQETQHIHYQYVVEYPCDTSVLGLDVS